MRTVVVITLIDFLNLIQNLMTLWIIFIEAVITKQSRKFTDVINVVNMSFMIITNNDSILLQDGSSSVFIRLIIHL